MSQHIIDITLHEKIFQNLQHAQRISIDIGGSLAKLAYLVNVPRKKTIYSISEKEQPYETEEMGAQLHFIKFETKCIESCLDFIQKHIATLPHFKSCKILKATGGGAYKYIDLIQEKLNLIVEREDEMDCLVMGCNFLLKHIPEETFSYHKHGNPEYEFQNINPNEYPYLLVNIGSGVSILKVDSETKYTRIGGTSLGGGTFWGLGSLLTQAKGFDELLALADKGDHRNVDMLIKDIYGGDYAAHNLPGNLIASSLGKTVRRSSVWYPPPNEELAHCQPIFYRESRSGSGSDSPIRTCSITIENVDFRVVDAGPTDRPSEHRHFVTELDTTVTVGVPLGELDRFTASQPAQNGGGVSDAAILRTGPTTKAGPTKGTRGSRPRPKSEDMGPSYKPVQTQTNQPQSFRKTSTFGQTFREEDIAHSLLIAISNDIGQIAYLNARLHDLKRIYFGGFFIRGHPLTMHTITYAINFWSKGEIRPLFLRHEGYLGAVGAFLHGIKQNDEDTLYSWGENYLGKSDLQNPLLQDFDFKESDRCLKKMDFLIFERFDGKLARFPLLADPDNYVADVEDLTRDSEAREYWLDLFIKSVDRYADQARSSQSSSPDVDERISKFREVYLSRLEYFSQNIYAYGHLSVRILLDACLQCLCQFGFTDPYLKEKQEENETALAQLPQYLNYLDGISDHREKQLALIKGILGGNIFDWGSRDILPLLESSHKLVFKTAMTKIPPRPWLFDDFDAWELKSRHHKYGCACIFVDNSGADIILGIFNFANELLTRGTKVIMCANSKPAFNDVIYPELVTLATKVANHMPAIKAGLESGTFVVMETGSGSPCLDLTRVNADLVDLIIRDRVDLVVLEGMGRAVHTNLYAKFVPGCDVMKIAVLKDQWFARRMGGDIFSVVFKFEQGTIFI